MPQPDWQEFLDFANGLADQARTIARRWFRSATAELKDDRTPVTEADRSIEEALRRRIREALPQHGIRGEEQPDERVDAEWCWVLDPIDGTKAFASGNPLFGTLIGLCREGRPVLGVMEAPALGERWSAAPGIPATHDGKAIAVRAPRPLADAVAYCTTPDPMSGIDGYRELRRRVAYTVFGGDCIAYGLLAMGGCDLIVDRGLKVHDFTALVPIIEAAGGVAMDWNGRSLHAGSDGQVVCASHRDLAEAARALLAG